MQIIEHVTIIVPLFSNPKNNSPQAVRSLHFRLPHSITYTTDQEVLGPVKSVKILGTLYSLLAQLSMLVHKILWVNCQHWEEEEMSKKEKKQHSVDVSQLFLSDQTVG